MTNREKLRQLLMDVFLLTENEFSFDLKRTDIETWDSLGVVSMAVGIQETFGCHLTPDQAISIASVGDIMGFLVASGVKFDD